LLPGAIGPDFVVSHSRAVQLPGKYEDSQNGSICFRGAVNSAEIRLTSKNTGDLHFKGLITWDPAGTAEKESAEFIKR